MDGGRCSTGNRRRVGEAHRGFLPGPVDGLQAVVALFLGLVATQRAEVRALAAEFQQRLENRRIGAAAFLQAQRQQAEDVRHFGEPFAGRRERQQRQVFEVQRQVVRQLRYVDLQAGPGIAVEQVDHRLATVAALAVDVLEEQQRDRAAALEETVVARLDVQQVALAELVEQRREAVAQRFRQFAGADQRMQAEALLAQLGAWIVE